jgi:hypothetical protein
VTSCSAGEVRLKTAKNKTNKHSRQVLFTPLIGISIIHFLIELSI